MGKLASAFFYYGSHNLVLLDMVCAFVNLRNFGVAGVFFQREIPRVGYASAKVYAPVGYLHRRIGTEKLCHGAVFSPARAFKGFKFVVDRSCF